MSNYLERPAIQPWARVKRSQQLELLLASTIPSIVALVVILGLGVHGAIGMITVFLPLQILAAGFVGVRRFGKKGFGDSLLLVLTIFFASVVMVLLLSVLYSVVAKGLPAMSVQFLSQNNVYVSTTTSLDYGGIGHAILGTLLVIILTTLAAVPLGLAMAVFLTQSQSRLTGVVRSFTQALSGLPSIVSGLFILSVVPFLGLGRSGLIGAMALFPLMLPTIARVAEEALKLVPSDLRMAALALGAPNYRAFFQVILPAAKSGVVTAVLLGLARIIGETAPLILTLNASVATNLNPFEGGLTTLPTYVYGFISSGYATSQSRAWGAAFVLVLLVGVLFGLARILSRSKSLKVTTSSKKKGNK
jgi:phosphate transport system permease protein